MKRKLMRPNGGFILFKKLSEPMDDKFSNMDLIVLKIATKTTQNRSVYRCSKLILQKTPITDTPKLPNRP